MSEQYTGSLTALRAFRAHHPAAAIYDQTYNGRTVWMTAKQVAIWSTIRAYWRQGKLLTLEGIANRVGCSRSHVSRFLHRLDLWRFINLTVFRGRGGGVVVVAIKSRPLLNLQIIRRNTKVAGSKLYQLRRTADEFFADLIETQRPSRVVIRSQLSLTDWIEIWGGMPLL